MRALIDDVLILSRLDEMAPGADEAEAVDLRAVAERVVGRLTKLAADADVEVHLKAEPVTVQGNETLLKQMIYNLVENAIRYNREGGHVLVEVCGGRPPLARAQAARGVRIGIIRVNDTGAGIPPISWRKSSSASTAWRRVAPRNWAARDWAWPSSSTPPFTTAARCSWKARKMSVLALQCVYPSADKDFQK